MQNTKKLVFIVLAIIVLGGILTCILPSSIRGIIIITTIVIALEFLAFEYLKFESTKQSLILAFSTGVVVIGWVVTGYINNQNELIRNRLANDQAANQKKRDLTTKFLLDAYFRLSNLDHRNAETISDAYIYVKFGEAALTEVQLFGDSETISYGQKYALSGGKDYYDTLLNHLRNNIRQELNLPSLSILDFTGKAFTYRFVPITKMSDTLTSEEQIQLVMRLNEINQEMLK